jgi:hypothetical protein
MVGEAKQEVREAAESQAARGFARWGLVAKGSLYVLIGAIAFQVSVLEQGRLEDRSGALAALADDWFGKLLVGAVAVGLAGYAFWRFAEAILGHPLEGGERDSVPRRLGLAARGFWYLGLCGLAVAVLAGADQSGGSREEDRITGRVMMWPAGRWIVAGVGIGILGAGVFNIWRGVTGSFRKNLKLRKMGKLGDRAFTIIGGIGHAARGVVFGLIGVFLVRAAYQYDPQEAVGLDGALAKVLQQDYGDTLLALVAAGLVAYGLYCYVEAVYREV